jgi:nicotinamide mononucleotide transporter
MDDGLLPAILGLFDVNRPLLMVMDYPMSGVELFGTVFNLASVYLMARRNIWTWPLGLVGVVLFAVLFYQIRLYGDFIEQIYYVGALLYGWRLWRERPETTTHTEMGFSTWPHVVQGLAFTLVGGVLLALLLLRLPVLLPSLFPEPPSFVYVDALTTTGSFVAMVLEAKRRIEAWIYWVIINLAGIWLYVVKGVPFVAALYGIFLILGFYGYLQWWTRSRRAEDKI